MNPTGTVTGGGACPLASDAASLTSGQLFGVRGREIFVFSQPRPKKRVVQAPGAFDPSLKTEVEVRFVAVDAAHTRVELEHRGLEAYGPEALAMREAFGSPNGWNGMLEHYAAVAGR